MHCAYMHNAFFLWRLQGITIFQLYFAFNGGSADGDGKLVVGGWDVPLPSLLALLLTIAIGDQPPHS
jgi:hypothetical protein